MKLFGILHDLDSGKLTARQPKALKVSIGLGAKCKDVHVHIGPTGQWMLTVGGKVTPFKTRELCQEAYRTLVNGAPERKAPRKLPYFTFTRPSPEGGQEPDFDAIAAHGPMPKEIEILVYGTLDEIWKPQMNNWGARELRCFGDGAVGHRLVALARTPDEKARVAPGAQRFDVTPCFAGGCKLATGDKPECKPHGALYFQLAAHPVQGGTTSYETTGFAGIKALGAVLENVIAEDEIATGMSLMLGVKPYIPRSGSGTAYHATLRPTPKRNTPAGEQPSAPVVPVIASELSPDEQAAVAAAFNAEFTDGE